MNQLNVSLQQTILTLSARGWSRRQIARHLAIDRETVGRYVRRAEGDSKPAIVPAGSAAGRRSLCLP
jgi:IS30 family transposase